MCDFYLFSWVCYILDSSIYLNIYHNGCLKYTVFCASIYRTNICKFVTGKWVQFHCTKVHFATQVTYKCQEILCFSLYVFCQEYDILSDHWITVTGDRLDQLYSV